MSESQQPAEFPNSDLLERFIDGLMTDAEADKFLAGIDDPQAAIDQRELQNQINESLNRSFKVDALDEEVLTRQFTQAAPAGHRNASEKNSSLSKTETLQQKPWFKLALAASLLLAISFGLWKYSDSGQVEAHFQPRALAVLYQETKDRGFKPYYNCEDEQRFADTFQTRHGHRLALSDMPAGSRMLGLSYPGGISRNTTAMLGEVDGNPVMVFVDAASNRDHVIQSVGPDSKLNVFLVEKNGLIFCEVTPLSSAKLIPHFEFGETQ